MTAVSWVRREPPLPARAVVARDDAVVGLAEAVEARLAAGADLRVCSGRGWLLALGEEGDLPWSDGVTYLGWDAGVLTPTTLRSTVPPDLLHLALRRRASAGHALLVAIGPDVVTAPMPTRAAVAGALRALPAPTP